MSRRSVPVDGRGLRRERNHRIIVDTCYELLRAGMIEPTADDVAERAGLGRRTVFRQFEDMEALAAAVHERVAREVATLLEPITPTGNVAADLRALVRLRARVFEYLAPFRRAADAIRHRSPFVRKQQALLARMTRRRLDALLGPALGEEGGRAREALDLVLSFEAWDRLRQEQKLSAGGAADVMLHAALAIAGRAKSGRRRRSP